MLLAVEERRGNVMFGKTQSPEKEIETFKNNVKIRIKLLFHATKWKTKWRFPKRLGSPK